MPIYEYVCSACGNEFEAMQKFSEKPLTTCTVCGKSGKVARKLSAPSFHLQGGGWYNEGYSGKKSEGTKSTAPAAAKSTDSAPKSAPAETKSTSTATKTPSSSPA
jgi:putative FmdB family regulatory protein